MDKKPYFYQFLESILKRRSNSIGRAVAEGTSDSCKVCGVGIGTVEKLFEQLKGKLEGSR